MSFHIEGIEVPVALHIQDRTWILLHSRNSISDISFNKLPDYLEKELKGLGLLKTQKPLRRYNVSLRLVLGTFPKAFFMASSRRIRFGGHISGINQVFIVKLKWICQENLIYDISVVNL